MSKARDLMTNLDAMTDAIGIRDGETTTPRRFKTVAGPIGSYSRNRSAADIDLEKIIPDPHQPRKSFDDDAISSLAADIEQRGLLEPIRVRWSADHDKFIVICGERRWRASRQAGLPRISCIIEDRELSEAELRAQQLVENILREDLKPIEEARSFCSLMELNSFNAKQLAAYLHISPAKVSGALSLLRLPEDVQQQIDSGSLPVRSAYKVAKEKDEDKQRQLAKQLSKQTVIKEPTTPTIRKTTSKPKRKRRTTNEVYRTTHGLKVNITGNKLATNEVIVAALAEVVDAIQTEISTQKKAA